MHPKLRLAALLVLIGAVGCADHESPLPTEGSGPASGPAAAQASDGQADAQRMERQARRLALALADPGYRAYLQAQLRESPVVEHKLQFQRLLSLDGRRTAGALARATGEEEAAVLSEAEAGNPAELYFPVAGHLERWDGGPNLLVATAQADHDVPVAFDTRGRRILLDPRAPPSTPVLALVPQETDFDRPIGRRDAICAVDDCGGGGNGQGGGGSSGGETGGPAGTPPSQSLYLTKAQFVDTFEGYRDIRPNLSV
jgi:hypothetical protein